MQKAVVIFLLLAFILLLSGQGLAGDFSIGGRGQMAIPFTLSTPETAYLFGPIVDYNLSQRFRLRGSFWLGSIEGRDIWKAGSKIIFDINPGGFNPYLGAGGSVMGEGEEFFVLPDIMLGSEVPLDESFSLFGEVSTSFLLLLGFSAGVSYNF